MEAGRVPRIRVMALAGLLAVSPAFAQQVSTSKLGVHLIHDNTAGVIQICNARPRVVKILDVNNGMLSAMRNYKNQAPNGIVVLRVYTTKKYTLAHDPAASAADFWTTVLLPAVNKLSASDRAKIDYLEGPNEGDTTPTWDTLEDALWFNAFWVALAPRIADAGFKPCAFSTAVGNPPGTVGEMQQKLSAAAPALRLCKQLGGAWSYHAYTPDWSKDVAFQLWYSLRYRQFYSYFAQYHPDLADLPLILTEAGYDSGGSHTGSGWQANGTAAQYQDWLTWWDAQILQDNYVLGSTIFQIGSPATWPSFDLEPIAGWLAAYLINHTIPVLTCSPTSFAHTFIQGGNPAPDSFTVTNTGSHTMNYSIAKSAAWLHVNPASGSSSGESDAIDVTYTASGLTAGTYNATITVTALGAGGSPRVIPVALTVLQVPIPGDLNGDRFVDSRDVNIFLGCMTGTHGGPPAPGCEAADLDNDGDVDQSDFGLMQNCISGDLIQGDPGCLES